MPNSESAYDLTTDDCVQSKIANVKHITAQCLSDNKAWAVCEIKMTNGIVVHGDTKAHPVEILEFKHDDFKDAAYENALFQAKQLVAYHLKESV